MISAASSPNVLKARQLAALRLLVDELVPENPFYTAKMKAAGLDGGIESLDDFLERMPFTTKAELIEDQRRNPPYGMNLTYPLSRYTRFNQTSGTTGTPMRWLDTPESWGWMVENWVKVFTVSGVTAEDRILFAFSFGPFLGFWTAFEAGCRLGCLCLPGGGMSSAARLRLLLDNRATVLCCTPTYAIRLAEVAREEGIDLSESAIQRIIVAGEPGGSIPATRAKIERLWPGASLRDHHGMTEIGPVSYECPERAGVLHVIEDAFIPEIIDPETGRRLPPDERGELVLTNLGRTGSPLLRYRTGDWVRPSTEPCPCGTHDMALVGGILARTDDMVVVRGVNLHPSALEEVVRGFTGIIEYRVEFCTGGPLPELRIEVEPDLDCSDPGSLCREVEDALRATFNLRIPVSHAEPGGLPRFEMKAKRWIRA